MDLLPHEAENKNLSVLSRKNGCRLCCGKLDKTVNKKWACAEAYTATWCLRFDTLGLLTGQQTTVGEERLFPDSLKIKMYLMSIVHVLVKNHEF